MWYNKENTKNKIRRNTFSKVMVVPELMHGSESWALDRTDDDGLK
jgi:hypothetical protein